IDAEASSYVRLPSVAGGRHFDGLLVTMVGETHLCISTHRMSTTPTPASLVSRLLPLAEELLVAGHLALGMMFAQVLHVDVVVGHAAAQAGGLHRPLAHGLKGGFHLSR